MINEQLRQRAEALAAEHNNDAYSVALAMLERERVVKAEAVREAFEGAKIPNGAKYGCIGEFFVHVENGGVCPECYNGHYDDEIDVECEICRGESVGGLYDVSHDIPWTTQKEIFKAFCKYAAQDYANKLEQTK